MARPKPAALARGAYDVRAPPNTARPRTQRLPPGGEARRHRPGGRRDPRLAAQLAAVATTPGYAAAVGIDPTITSAQLRGAVLACGPYDLRLARQSIESGSRFVQIVLWAYSGRRHFL